MRLAIRHTQSSLFLISRFRSSCSLILQLEHTAHSVIYFLNNNKNKKVNKCTVKKPAIFFFYYFPSSYPSFPPFSFRRFSIIYICVSFEHLSSTKAQGCWYHITVPGTGTVPVPGINCRRVGGGPSSRSPEPGNKFMTGTRRYNLYSRRDTDDCTQGR
jgi:hypothetical protein